MRSLICLFVLVVMTGCSCSEEAEKSVAEKAAEKAMEAHTGKEADIKFDDESMRIKTDDGEMSLTSGKSATLPDNFPKDIPMYEGFVLDMAMEVPEGYSLSFTTKDEVSTVVQWYLTELTNQGWTKEANMDMGEQTMLVFKKSERGVHLAISSDNNQTRISLNSVNR
jgi:hypothetical protein